MKSICLIIPYFGKWPKWFNIYLETCRCNPAVDWLFFTDCKIPEETGQNTKFFKMDLNDFNVLASQKLGLKVNIKNTPIFRFNYKLVDFKPAYGAIFEDYLKTYDFWGYSDIDIVYGDIRKFIMDDMLETYDVITARKAYLVGHFTIYKNADKINRLYQKASGYKRVFLNADRWYNFTECAKAWNYLVQGGNILSKKPMRERIAHFSKCRVNRLCELLGLKSPFWVAREVKSMTECIKRLEKEGYLKSFFENIGAGCETEYKREGDDWKLYWHKGRLAEVNTEYEIMYFHFLKLKFDEKFVVPDWHKTPEKFFITKEGLFEE